MTSNSVVGIFWDELEKVIRIDNRMSLREFCDKAEISPGTLQNLRDRASPDDLQPFTVRKIAAAFGWTVPQFNEWWKGVKSSSDLPASEQLKRFEQDLVAEAAERGITIDKLIAEIRKQRPKPAQHKIAAKKHHQ